MKSLAGRFAAIILAAVVFCVGGYWFFFAGGSAGIGSGGSGQEAATQASQSKVQEGKAADGGEAAAVDAKDVKEAQEKAKEEAEKKEGKSPYPLQVMIMEAKRVEGIEGAKSDGPFLIVKASIGNVDKKPVSVVPQGIALVDRDEDRHSVSKDGMEALAARQVPVFSAVDIPAGAAATASLVFELDADEHPAALTIQPAGGGDVMKFHLPDRVKEI